MHDERPCLHGAGVRFELARRVENTKASASSQAGRARHVWIRPHALPFGFGCVSRPILGPHQPKVNPTLEQDLGAPSIEATEF